MAFGSWTSGGNGLAETQRPENRSLRAEPRPEETGGLPSTTPDADGGVRPGVETPATFLICSPVFPQGGKQEN